MRWLLSLVVLASLLGCAGTPTPTRAARALPAGWASVAAWDFERLVADLAPGPWTSQARQALDLELRAEGLTSVRAAVLLAWGDRPSHELLLVCLEERSPRPERHGDAALVVAAAAVGRLGGDDAAARLCALAVGTDPHPDLEVRVECAAGALDLGRTCAVPFLLRVLHAGTPAQLQDPIDWEPTDTLAWSKSRAAEALSRRAGLPCSFRPDGSFAHQMAEAERLARALDADG